jgi:hypothetical protein
MELSYPRPRHYRRRVDLLATARRWSIVSLFIPGVVLSAAAPAVGAQSLADAAARAKEQRQAHPDTPSWTDRDLAAGAAAGNREAIALELTMPLLQQYYGVRTAILRAMVQSPTLARQVLGAIGRAGREGVGGLEREYTNIPPAVDAIRAGQMTVHDYVVTEVAFMATVGVLAGKLSVSGAPAGTIGTNIEFLKRHEQEIATLHHEASVLEEQLARQAAAPIPPR